MYLLDANVVSELRKAPAGKADSNMARWVGQVPATSLFLSVFTILELELGVLLMERRDPRHGEILRRWLDRRVMLAFANRILTIDVAVVRLCARLHVFDPCAERDALIAATSLVHGLTVVTRNRDDFVATGVALLNPRRTG